MNPYSILTQIGEFAAQDATLVKPDGARIPLKVKPESAESEAIGGDAAPGAVALRSWSTNIDGVEAAQYPNAGDRLEIVDETGATVSYTTTRDATTGRFWSWRYLKRGARIVFYTKFNPDARK